MDYLHQVYLENHYPYWIIKNQKRNLQPINWSGSKEKHINFCLFMFQVSVKNFGESSVIPNVIFNSTNILESILRHPKNEIPLNLKQNIVYKWSCCEECCSQSYIGMSRRCLENGVKEQSSPANSTTYIHSESKNHPMPTFPLQSNRSRKHPSFQKTGKPSTSGSATWHSIITHDKFIFKNCATAF